MSVYPSDAPLPKIQVTAVRGMASALDVAWQFEGAITNYQEIKTWWSSRGMGNGEVMLINSVVFVNGMHTFAHDPTNALFSRETIGTWWPFSVKYYTDPSYPVLYEFSPQKVCEIYIPYPDEMTPDVWTDLQFTVSPPIPEVSWIVIIPLAIFGIGALAYWYLKRRK
ncbi:hypothetical protein MUP77_07660 [Candidatus Bathyarchaeota archaeon]|nr:hypothetical protein [Candidatus Bathyarchaeota archaeon]